MESNKEDGRAPFSALILSVNMGIDIIYCIFHVYPVYLSIPVGTVSQGLHASTLGSTISVPITNPTLMSDGTEHYPYTMQKSKSAQACIWSDHWSFVVLVTFAATSIHKFNKPETSHKHRPIQQDTLILNNDKLK